VGGGSGAGTEWSDRENAGVGSGGCPGFWNLGGQMGTGLGKEGVEEAMGVEARAGAGAGLR